MGHDWHSVQPGLERLASIWQDMVAYTEGLADWVDRQGSRARASSAVELASRLPREHQWPEPPEFIAGTLPYMAPEQTARMNRSIDSRSDLYAFGVTLYEMLTGRLPTTCRRCPIVFRAKKSIEVLEKPTVRNALQQLWRN